MRQLRPARITVLLHLRLKKPCASRRGEKEGERTDDNKGDSNPPVELAFGRLKLVYGKKREEAVGVAGSYLLYFLLSDLSRR